MLYTATDQSEKFCYRSTDAGAHWSLVSAVIVAGQPTGSGSVPVQGDFGPLVVEPGAPDDAWLGLDRNGPVPNDRRDPLAGDRDSSAVIPLGGDDSGVGSSDRFGHDGRPTPPERNPDAQAAQDRE